MTDCGCSNFPESLGNVTFGASVGIGTSDPRGKLHIVGDDGPISLPPTLSHADVVVSNNGHSLLHVVTPSGYVGGIVFDDPDGETRGYLRYSHLHDDFQIFTAGSRRLTVDSEGNVGIGVSDPEVRLDLLSPSETVARFKSSASASQAATYLNVQNDADVRLSIGVNSSGHDWPNRGFVWMRESYDLQFVIGSAEAMRIMANGNVGIGQAWAGERVEVNGNVKANGAFYAGGRKVADFTGCYYAD